MAVDVTRGSGPFEACRYDNEAWVRSRWSKINAALDSSYGSAETTTATPTPMPGDSGDVKQCRGGLAFESFMKSLLREHPHGGLAYDVKDEVHALNYVDACSLDIAQLSLLADVLSFVFMFRAPLKPSRNIPEDAVIRTQLRKAIGLNGLPDTPTALGSAAVMRLAAAIQATWPSLQPLKHDMKTLSEYAAPITVFSFQSCPLQSQMTWVVSVAGVSNLVALIDDTRSAFKLYRYVDDHHPHRGHAFDAAAFERVGDYYSERAKTTAEMSLTNPAHLKASACPNLGDWCKLADAPNTLFHMLLLNFIYRVKDHAGGGWECSIKEEGERRPTRERARELMEAGYVVMPVAPRCSLGMDDDGCIKVVDSATTQPVPQSATQGKAADVDEVRLVCEGFSRVHMWLLMAMVAHARQTLGTHLPKGLKIPAPNGRDKYDYSWAANALDERRLRLPEEVAFLARVSLTCLLHSEEAKRVRTHASIIGCLSTVARSCNQLDLKTMFEQTCHFMCESLAVIEVFRSHRCAFWSDIICSKGPEPSDQKMWAVITPDIKDCIANLIIRGFKPKPDKPKPDTKGKETPCSAASAPNRKRSSRGYKADAEHISGQKSLKDTVAVSVLEEVGRRAVELQEAERKAAWEALNRRACEELGPCLACSKSVTADTTFVCARCSGDCKSYFHDQCWRARGGRKQELRQARCPSMSCQSSLRAVWRKTQDGRKQHLLEPPSSSSAPIGATTKPDDDGQRKPIKTPRELQTSAKENNRAKEKTRHAPSGTASERRKARRAHLQSRPTPVVGAPGSKYGIGITPPAELHCAKNNNADTSGTAVTDTPEGEGDPLEPGSEVFVDGTPMNIDTKHVDTSRAARLAVSQAVSQGLEVEGRPPSGTDVALVPLHAKSIPALAGKSAPNVGRQTKSTRSKKKGARKQPKKKVMNLEVFRQQHETGRATKSEWPSTPTTASYPIEGTLHDLSQIEGQIEGH